MKLPHVPSLKRSAERKCVVGTGRTSGGNMALGVSLLLVMTGLTVAAVMINIFAGASMLYTQKLTYAAYAGANYTMELIGPDPVSPVTISAAQATQIQNTVQQQLVALGVPGGASASVTPSIDASGQNAVVSVLVSGFALPGLPSGAPGFPSTSFTASVPLSHVLSSPPMFVTLNTYSAGTPGSPNFSELVLLPAYAPGTAVPAGSSVLTMNVARPLVGVGPVNLSGTNYNVLNPSGL